MNQLKTVALFGLITGLLVAIGHGIAGGGDALIVIGLEVI